MTKETNKARKTKPAGTAKKTETTKKTGATADVETGAAETWPGRARAMQEFLHTVYGANLTQKQFDLLAADPEFYSGIEAGTVGALLTGADAQTGSSEFQVAWEKVGGDVEQFRALLRHGNWGAGTTWDPKKAWSALFADEKFRTAWQGEARDALRSEGRTVYGGAYASPSGEATASAAMQQAASMARGKLPSSVEGVTVSGEAQSRGVVQNVGGGTIDTTVRQVDGSDVIFSGPQAVASATQTLRPTKLGVESAGRVVPTEEQNVQSDTLFETWSWVPDSNADGLGASNRLKDLNRQHAAIRFSEPLIAPRDTGDAWHEDNPHSSAKPMQWDNDLAPSRMTSEMRNMVAEIHAETKGEASKTFTRVTSLGPSDRHRPWSAKGLHLPSYSNFSPIYYREGGPESKLQPAFVQSSASRISQPKVSWGGKGISRHVRAF